MGKPSIFLSKPSPSGLSKVSVSLLTNNWPGVGKFEEIDEKRKHVKDFEVRHKYEGECFREMEESREDCVAIKKEKGNLVQKMIFRSLPSTILSLRLLKPRMLSSLDNSVLLMKMRKQIKHSLRSLSRCPMTQKKNLTKMVQNRTGAKSKRMKK